MDRGIIFIVFEMLALSLQNVYTENQILTCGKSMSKLWTAILFMLSSNKLEATLYALVHYPRIICVK